MSTDMNLSKLKEILEDREASCSPQGHKVLDTT